MFGIDIPGRGPVGSEVVGLGGGEPASLFLASRPAARAARHDRGVGPSRRAPSRTSDGCTRPLRSCSYGERPGPAPFVRHVSQQPPRLPMVGLALEDRSQAQARQRVRGRIGLGGALGQLESSWADRDSISFRLARHGSFPVLAGTSRDDFGKRHEPRGAVRVDRPGHPLANPLGGRSIPLPGQSLEPGFLSSAALAGDDRPLCRFQLARGVRSPGRGEEPEPASKGHRSSPGNPSPVPSDG